MKQKSHYRGSAKRKCVQTFALHHEVLRVRSHMRMHALESSVYAEARSQERKMAWQRRKAGTSASAETPIRFLQNFRSDTVASADSLQRKTPRSAVYGLATRNLYAYDVHATKMRARYSLTSSILRTVCITVHKLSFFRQSRSCALFACVTMHTWFCWSDARLAAAKPRRRSESQFMCDRALNFARTFTTLDAKLAGNSS